VSVNWVRDTPRDVSVGYDGDFVYGQVQVDQWQEPSTFETELHEKLEALRTRMVAEQKRLHEMDGDD
jgi:hypothetical protein